MPFSSGATIVAAALAIPSLLKEKVGCLLLLGKESVSIESYFHTCDQITGCNIWLVSPSTWLLEQLILRISNEEQKHVCINVILTYRPLCLHVMTLFFRDGNVEWCGRAIFDYSNLAGIMTKWHWEILQLKLRQDVNLHHSLFIIVEHLLNRYNKEPPGKREKTLLKSVWE